MRPRRVCLKRVALVLGTALGFAGDATALTIGVIGDSFSDEYQATSAGRFLGYEGFSWVEILAQLRPAEVDFGAFDPTLGALSLPNGYAHNHALKGSKAAGGPVAGWNVLANAADAGLINPALGQLDDIGQNRTEQVASVAADITAGNVDVALLWLGGNDFQERRDGGFSFDPANTFFQAFQTNLVNALVGAVDALIAAGATDILLARVQVIDFTRADIITATASTNALLEAAMATRSQVTFFDALAGVGARFDPGTNTFDVSGWTIVPGAAPQSALVAPPGVLNPAQCGYDNRAAALTPACPTAAYQGFSANDDNTHPTTPIQGLIANSILAALANRGFQVTQLTDAEILGIAGVSVPEPSAAALLVLAGAALALRRR
jgi:hypothetical protein